MFRQERLTHKESTLFYILRILTATIVILLYASYIIFLFFQILFDMPVVQPVRELLVQMDVPDIEICGYSSDVEIVRCVFTWMNWSSSVYPYCQREDGFNYVWAGPRPDPNVFCYLFTANGTMTFGSPETTTGLRNIDFYFKINNLTAATSNVISVGAIAAQLFDPSFNPLWNKSKIVTSTDKYVNDELHLQGNNFAGVQNTSTVVKILSPL